MGLVVGRLIFEGTAEPMAQGNGCVVYKRCGCADAVTGKRLGGRCMLLDMADHGRWYFAVQTTGLTGRRERVRRGGYATKEDAAEAGAEFLAVQEDGPIGSASTTGQWLRHWLATHQGLRPTTRKSYDDHIRLYLLPYLGRIRLSELTGPDVRRMFAALVARRNRYGEPIASATLDRIRATLRASLTPPSVTVSSLSIPRRGFVC
jgi:hypothetical protein